MQVKTTIEKFIREELQKACSIIEKRYRNCFASYLIAPFEKNILVLSLDLFNSKIQVRKVYCRQEYEKLKVDEFCEELEKMYIHALKNKF